MPEFVNNKLGSPEGIKDEEGNIRWSFDSKNFKKESLKSSAVFGIFIIFIKYVSFPKFILY